MNKGSIFVISAPSGCGKDTLLNEVFKQKTDVFFSISSITRAMRPGEKEGEKYHFISRDEFENGLKNGDFLEHNVYLDNYYGTPKAPVLKAVEQGKDAIIECDVNGAAQIREKLPECVSIFIMPPSIKALSDRLHARASETEEQIKKRVAEAAGEIGCAGEFDYVIVNDVLEQAAQDLLTVMNSCKFKTINQKNFIKEVLKNA